MHRHINKNEIHIFFKIGFLVAFVSLNMVSSQWHHLCGVVRRLLKRVFHQDSIKEEDALTSLDLLIA